MTRDLPPGGHRVMVVEDQYLVSSDLADALEDLGFSVVGPFATNAEALDWLRSEIPDSAILDIQLKDGDCSEVARELRRRGVPMVFFTGDLGWPPLKEEFADLPAIAKPASAADLLKVLAEIVS